MKTGFILFGVLFMNAAFADTASTSPTPASLSVAIPCLTDKGDVANAKESEVCKSILPKCSVVKSQLIDKTRNDLSMMIWGFYHKKKIDLNLSTKDNLVGTDMPNPICSVVGQKVKFSGNKADIELTQQLIGNKESCGIRPNLIPDENKRNASIQFKGDAGGQWNSYMLGVYPWLMRRYAHDVFAELKDDLSNMGEVVHSQAMAASAAKLALSNSTVVAGLSAEAKSVCTSGTTSLVNDCVSGAISATDPAQKICTLVKAQQLTATGSLPSMITGEIMARVQTFYDARIATILNDRNPDYVAFKQSCAVSRGLFNTREYGLSCIASCIFTGEDFITHDDDWIIMEISKDPRHSTSGADCEHPSQLKLSGDWKRRADTFWFNRVFRNEVNYTVNYGFAAFLERIIRTEICQQSRNTDSNVCDDVNIPSEPAK